MRHIKIVQHFNHLGSFVGYKIQETVTDDGLYITWDGLFEHKSSAVQEIERELKITLTEDQYKSISCYGTNF